MIEFVGKMLVAGSKQEKRTLVICYGLDTPETCTRYKSFHKTLPMQACAYLCLLIDLFHLATIDQTWDLHKRSYERTSRCLCGVGTLGRLYFLKTMCNTNLPFVGGFFEQYRVYCGGRNTIDYLSIVSTDFSRTS